MGLCIVTGLPRSGTSFMMQTLVHLGLNYKEKKDNIAERLRDANPKGFYEGPESRRGLTEPEEDYSDGVYKIFFKGIKASPFNLIKDAKFIFCVRNPISVLMSQRVMFARKEDRERVNDRILTRGVSHPKLYVREIKDFLEWVVDKGLKKNFLFIDYEEHLSDTYGVIEKISKFLDISPTKDQIEEAYNNVDLNLYRSVPTETWARRGVLEVMADVIYEKLKTDKPFTCLKKEVDNGAGS
jgi:hypothetical protein